MSYRKLNNKLSTPYNYALFCDLFLSSLCLKLSFPLKISVNCLYSWGVVRTLSTTITALAFHFSVLNHSLHTPRNNTIVRCF